MRVLTSQLRGMTADLSAKLHMHGLIHSDSLLEAVKTPADRQALAAKVGVNAADILELANRADLARIKGIGKVFSDLLERAGVDTVRELSHRVPENLHAKLAEINTKEKVAGRDARLDEVQDWVAQAKGLPRILEY